MLEFLSQPWHWAISGALIILNMWLLHWLGQRFGVSSSLEAICSLSGAGKRISYFKKDWRQRAWLLFYVCGAVIGGAIAIIFLESPAPVEISQSTIDYLDSVGVEAPAASSLTGGYAPSSVFSFDNLFTLQGFIIMIVGGMLIGFGTRYAGGCTSGHAISGLSNLQAPSLVAVIGFFIGGLLMSHFILPLVLAL